MVPSFRIHSANLKIQLLFENKADSVVFWRCRRNGMAGDCKSSDFGHNWFDPNHLHQFSPFSIMVLHLFCNQVTAVRFCQGAPILCGLLVIMVAQWLCKPRVGVRFSYGPPSFMRSFITIAGSTCYLRGNRSDRSSFYLRVVKWYHPCFGSM